jgi:plastocyanin
MKKGFVGLSLAAVLGLALVACSAAVPAVYGASSKSETASSLSGDAYSTDPVITATLASGSEVVMSGFKFSPADLTVKVGTRVTWTNNDSAGHDVSARDGSFNSSSLGKGQTFSIVFDNEGTYDYVCTFHPGMDGRIIVAK